MDNEQMEGPQRAVVFWDGSEWIGMCLEHYIAAHAETVDELLERLTLTIEAERQESTRLHGAAFAGIEPAPERYHQMWEKQATPFRAKIEDRVELALCA